MSEPDLKPLIVIGGGGHASVLTEILLAQGRRVLAIISPEDISQRSVFKGVNVLKNDESILKFDKEKILLVNGIGMIPKSATKYKINEYYLSLGYQFETVVANTAQVSPFAKVFSGAQILAGAIVQAGAQIGSHSIINTRAIIDHDCEIGQYNHVAPGATLCGQVKSDEGVYIGAGAVVIQNIILEQKVVVGAGTTVLNNVAANKVVYGVYKNRSKNDK